MQTVRKFPYRNPEIWGGIECTINRVGDIFRDQLEEVNHYNRTGDLDHLANLGIHKLRYPLLWEKHQPLEDGKIDWQWSRQQLKCLTENKIIPIAGLLHHGSGPSYTNLLDPSFPAKFASYSSAVACEFPWLTYYTPVNEPLTTSRFSGLYGYWYPHLKSQKSFFQMLLNQVKGIICSMKAIRTINPEARLVQTEDLAKIHSTPLLQYQADFENERRWLTYDLLCGLVNRNHYFWKYLRKLGIAEPELNYFLENPCPPDIMGLNYYVTSERFLCEEVDRFPLHNGEGNGKHSYVDVEAARTNSFSGLGPLLKEAWNRYHLPIAITESHLNCSREEQLRWFKETWDTCCQLKKEGLEIKAVTAWAMFGAYDWHNLLTRVDHQYEPGVFSVQDNFLRPTALSKMIRGLATTGDYEHPLVATKGWWHNRDSNQSHSVTAPVLILGANGTLGHAFCRICERRSIVFHAITRQKLNILDRNAIEMIIQQYKPWAIINTIGYVRVDDAEQNEAECFDLNANAPALLAETCYRQQIRFMSFSSDLVFDGTKTSPYHEQDQVCPLNIYGASKAAAEKMILAANPDALMIRSSAFFGPWDQYNFAYQVLDSLTNSRSFPVPNDVVVSPTYVPDLVNASMDLFIDEEKGIWNISNTGATSWEHFAENIAARAGHANRLLVPKSGAEMGWKAKRPLYSVLKSEKGVSLASLDNALERYFEQKTY